MEERKKIIVICGPTASGKTSLSIELAKRFNGEIISADSMQVYKNLDIGTAKATTEEQTAAKHHLIDFLMPNQPYNVEIFTRLAKEKIEVITAKGKLPIVVGGTGLYVESLVNGITFTDQPDVTGIRNEYQKLAEEKGTAYLYDLLCSQDPVYAKTVHPNNVVRVIRALTIYRATGKTMSRQISASKPKQQPFNSLIIATGFKDREKLYANINTRVDSMVSQGIEKEAKYVFENKDAFLNSAAAIGYKEFFPYFEGTDTFENCVEKLKQASRNYAKRQLTWFNRMENINWLYVDDREVDCKEKAIEITDQFLK